MRFHFHSTRTNAAACQSNGWTTSRAVGALTTENKADVNCKRCQKLLAQWEVMAAKRAAREAAAAK